MNEMLKKNLIRGLAVVLAVAMVVPIGAQFRDASLKATEDDVAAEAPAPAPEPEVVVQEVVVEAPPAPAPVAEEPAPAAEESAPVEEAPAEETAAPVEGEKAEVEESAEPEETTEEAEQAGEQPEGEKSEEETEEKPEEEKLCTCGAEEGQPHAPECPLYEEEKTEEEEEAEIDIIITYTAAEGGSVSVASEKLAVKSGVAQGSTAVAAEGYRFVNWTRDGAEVGTDETLVPAKEEDRNVAAEYVAHFEPVEAKKEEYVLTVTVSSNLDGVAKVRRGTVMLLTAHAEDTGNRELKYQWQVSTDGGAGWADIAGATGAQFGVALDENNIRNLWRVSVTAVD